MSAAPTAGQGPLAMICGGGSLPIAVAEFVSRRGRPVVLFPLYGAAEGIAVGRFALHLDSDTLRTLTVVTLVFSGQAVFYVSRERRHLWSSRPGRWLLASSVVDLTFISLLATNGVLMTALPLAILAGLLVAATAFAFLLDAVKLAVFRRLQMA